MTAVRELMSALPRTIWVTQPPFEARVFDYETSAALAVDSWDHPVGPIMKAAFSRKAARPFPAAAKSCALTCWNPSRHIYAPVTRSGECRLNILPTVRVPHPAFTPPVCPVDTEDRPVEVSTSRSHPEHENY